MSLHLYLHVRKRTQKVIFIFAQGYWDLIVEMNFRKGEFHSSHVPFDAYCIWTEGNDEVVEQNKE